MFKHSMAPERAQERRRTMTTVEQETPPDAERLGYLNEHTEPDDFDDQTSDMGVYYSDSGWTLRTELDGTASSLASWEEDDVEKETSKRVAAMLSELDEALYEGKPLSKKELQDECNDWVSKFPYLRIIGKQVVPIHRNVETLGKHNTQSLGANTSKGLSIIGRRLKPASDVAQVDNYEEVFAADGCSSDLSGDAAESSTKMRIVNALFDLTWPKIAKSLNIVDESDHDEDSNNRNDNRQSNSPIRNDQPLPIADEAEKPKRTSVVKSAQNVPSERFSSAVIAKQPVLPRMTSAYKRFAGKTGTIAEDFSRSIRLANEQIRASRRESIISSAVPSSIGRLSRLPPIERQSQLPNVPFRKPHQVSSDTVRRLRPIAESSISVRNIDDHSLPSRRSVDVSNRSNRSSKFPLDKTTTSSAVRHGPSSRSTEFNKTRTERRTVNDGVQRR